MIMGIPYKAFYCKRIVFCTVLALFFSLFLQEAGAYDNLFTVEGVHVDVTAENSVAARDQAFVEAQKQAFEILKVRMVSGGQTASVQTPDPMVISTLIRDYEITDEQLSAVRYVGTYTFRFNESAVSRYFSGTGVAFTNTSSKPLLVLPFFQQAGRNVLWSEDNDWLRAWGRAQLPQGLVPVAVPIGDLMDVADMGKTQGLNYDAAGLSRMLVRYGTEEAALMLAVPDRSLSGPGGDDAPAQGDMIISIYRTDRAGPELVQDFVVSAGSGETRGQMYDRAALQAYRVLQDDWKNKTSASAARQSRVVARVPFASLKEWVDIQQELNAVSGIGKVSILSVKMREAMVEFVFRGDESRLQRVLSQSNFSLNGPYAVPGNARYNDPSGHAQPASYYELIRGRAGGGRYNRFNPAAQEPSAGDVDMDASEAFGVQTF